ncbi:unnamed protein product [Arctogadus glacialis]
MSCYVQVASSRQTNPSLRGCLQSRAAIVNQHGANMDASELHHYPEPRGSKHGHMARHLSVSPRDGFVKTEAMRREAAVGLTRGWCPNKVRPPGSAGENGSIQPVSITR